MPAIAAPASVNGGKSKSPVVASPNAATITHPDKMPYKTTFSFHCLDVISSRIIIRIKNSAKGMQKFTTTLFPCHARMSKKVAGV